MELECTKLGNNKSISLNSKYNLINESDTRYTLVNDRGIQAYYAKNLFRVIPEAPIVPEVPPIPVINELNIETSCRNTLVFTINCPVINGFTFQFISKLNFRYSQTSFSCGITGLQGLGNFEANIFMAKTRFQQFITINRENFTLNLLINIDELFQDITRSLIQDIIANFQGENGNRAGLLIMSTTTHVSDLLKDVLNELATTSTTSYNPNSGNNIIMWTFIVNEERNQDELDEENNEDVLDN